MNTIDIPQPSPSELAAMASALVPKQTYFFKRSGDGKILAVSEHDANEIMRNRNTWMRRDFEYLGTSDGKTYFDFIEKAKNITKQKQKELKTLNENLTRYIKTQDRLKFDELVDENDPRLTKVETLIKKIEKKTRLLQEELNDVFRKTHEEAFQAELKKAKSDKTLPPNTNILTPTARSYEDRKRIISQMPR
ncbi:MAG: hypothetical protein VW270_16700 [Candidatus Poseidoniales archaeon]|jgi:hypothetical protein